MNIYTKAGCVALLTGMTFAATVGDASAYMRDRYSHQRTGVVRHGYGYRGGYGPGAAVAGAALGIVGAATAGLVANQYYNGYPAYSYGPGYAPSYGYDYHPGHGYYGPY